jgi:hypothetical protein
MGQFFKKSKKWDWTLSAQSTSSTLYLCEGESEAEYVDYWLTQRGESPEAIRVLCFRGLSHIKTKISVLRKEPGLVKVDKICVFLDAEQNFDGRKDQVRQMLGTLNFPNSDVDDIPWIETKHNKTSSVFISPDSESNGRIEDIVLLELQGKEEAYACLDRFKNCATQANLTTPFGEKHLVASYLVLIKPGMSLGAAFQKGVFDQSHTAYVLLNQVLESALPGDLP